MKVLLLLIILGLILITNSKAYTPKRFNILQHFDDVVKTQIPILALLPTSLTSIAKAFKFSDSEENESVENSNIYKRHADFGTSQQGLFDQFSFKDLFQQRNIGKTFSNIISNQHRHKRRSRDIDITDWVRVFHELWRNPPNKIRRAFDECFRLLRQQHGFGILGGIMRNTADTVDIFNNFTQNINGKTDENNRIVCTVSNAIRKLTDAMPGSATHDVYYNAFSVMPELLADFLNHPVVKNHMSKIYNSDNYRKFEEDLKEFRKNIFNSGHQVIKRSDQPKPWFNWQQ